MVGVRGCADDRINRGRLDAKDLFGWQANASDDRLTRPLIRRDGALVETDWDTAMTAIVAHSRTLLRADAAANRRDPRIGAVRERARRRGAVMRALCWNDVDELAVRTVPDPVPVNPHDAARAR
ncbi:hypothetical protein NN3_28430 [Nocardia neocaledoniensis NBRC 108232]|uniref:Molybdopterin-dependent oxidoreductase-like protein n=1 Tax=Nocardia neocaledoniensis TaxID=236511 RepID=A0A317NK06_9NOCA|nr:hypothetical protein DFR69_105187 [Nocardia neocaledoniensis]GEM31836.1 hypothetical protein NN3_28430 [Nocardia neocaledoniensis NBRC 108232]